MNPTHFIRQAQQHQENARRHLLAVDTGDSVLARSLERANTLARQLGRELQQAHAIAERLENPAPIEATK